MSAEGAGLLREAARVIRVDAPGLSGPWHPAVALAVADLLENLASDEPWDFRHDDALAVARAYLGSASQ